jgi:eukaryotic-like serine/threonine-protein kinase
MRTDYGSGRFIVDMVVGEGGTARVFRGKDTSTGEPVAVKVLRRVLLDSEEVVARFELEADLLTNFEHPNILALLGRGRIDGLPWFACSYAAQGSLADVMLRRGHLEARDLLGWTTEILDALHYLHQQGIVHRDVKPENILLDQDDVAMLCDFGIALSPTRRATMVGDRIGTPSFMPPEQYTDPEKVTPQADLYGLGVTLFTALTGQTGMMLLVDHLRRDALSAMPPRIAAIVDRATSVKAIDRYANAWDLSLDIADVLEDMA